jgi:hypothetical protein
LKNRKQSFKCFGRRLVVAAEIKYFVNPFRKGKKMLKKMLFIVVLSMSVIYANAAKIGDWSFEEGEGQGTYNAVPGGLNLRLGSSDSTWQDPQWSTDGYSGNCLRFVGELGSGDGDTDILRPTSTADVSAFYTQTFTIDARINLDSIPLNTFDWYNPYTIMSFGGKDAANSNKDVFFLRVTQRSEGVGMLNGYIYSEDGVGHSFSHSADIIAGQWYNVGFSVDSTSTTDNVSLWVNGVEETKSTSAVARTDLTVNGESLVLGAMWVRSRSLNGRLDEVKFYDSVEAVPEPATFALMAGAACFGVLRRKDKK